MEPRSYNQRVLGWGLLVLASPLAILAATHSPNEYKATLGIDAPDCDGPFETYMLVGLALLVYGVGFLGNVLCRWNRWNMLVAMICLAICTALGVSYHRAMLVEDAQREACPGG